MDTQSQEVLAEILKLDKDSLSVDQRDFLIARRSYLNDADRARFKDVIEAHEKGLKGGKKAE